jgi:PKD repeat protein
MHHIRILFVFVLITTFAFTQDYSRVKVFANAEGLAQLSNLGVAVDHGTYKQNTFFISDFSSREIQIMQENGFEFEILIPDVQQYYIDQIASDVPQKNAACSGTPQASGFSPSTPSNFNLGTMGGYLKYTEMLAELDAMVAQYPNLITAKSQISNFLTHENRPIYYVRLSDNPNTDENAEPKVLYTAIHHAREPMSLMETIFYMWYLLENYGTNDEVTYLVNNLQLYFVPCINPDGYVYNQTTNPNGGGMWRKNRRNNGGGVYGVDLNRNYSYGWGTTGTSTNTSNDTYCGTAPFSEPETQAIRWLVQNNDFTTAFNAHTYAEDILFPIGTTTAEFAMHHNYFQAETNHMVQYNGYTAQKSSALYPASGDSDDYMYKVDIGVNQKDTIFAHTPEVGTAFWQPSSQIDATCKEMVFPNLILAHIARKYVIVSDADPSTVATLSGNFNHTAYRLGRENGPVTVSIQPLLNVASVGSPVIHNLAVMQTAPGAISYTLPPTIQFGDEIKYIILTDNGMWVKRDTITKTYGSITLQTLEDATSSSNWVASATWATTGTTFVSASKSFTDSPSGNYTNNANKTYTYVPTIDLTNATSAMISYYAKWNIEADYDYVQFQVSTDNGATWTGQCTNYTVPGTSANGSVQPNNQPVYEGVQSSWVLDEINLSDYLGQVIKVRFQLRTDGAQQADGFYFDDFKIFFNEQGPVTPPTANFTVSNSTICEGQSVSFTDFSANIPTTWSWNFGDNSISSDQNPTHVYSTPGTYNVSLTVTNSAGNDAYTMTNAVTVLAAPTVTLSSNISNNTICINDGPAQLNVSPVGATLLGNGISGSSFDPAAAGLGMQQIIASYTDLNGCTGSDTINILVEDCANIDNLFYSGVTIQPNPNNGEFIISGIEEDEEIIIFDLNSKVIFRKKSESSVEKIKIEKLDAGVYYLQTTKSGRLGQMKFAVY